MGLLLLILAALGASIFGAVVGRADTSVKAGSPPLRLNGGFSPKSLPRLHGVPITIHLAGRVDPEEGVVPSLREVTVKIDRSAEINADGYTTCAGAQARTTNALQRCKGAVVAFGRAHAVTGNELMGLSLALVNGGVKHGARVLYLLPTGSSTLLTAEMGTVNLTPLQRGRFGLKASIDFPQLQDGVISDFNLTFNRRRLGSKTFGFFNARCTDGHLDLEVDKYVFTNKEEFEGEQMSQTCSSF